MNVRHRRITAGIVVALALGAFGPIQRAVSMESRTYLELEGPIPGPFSGGIASLYLNSRRGAAASWRIQTPDRLWYITFLAATGDNGFADIERDGYLVRGAGDRHAVLQIDCGTYCKTRTFVGTDTFTHDATFTTASFSGTLVAEDGASCTVDAVWRSRSGPNVTYARDERWVSGRTRQPALLDLESSCIGSHRLRGIDDAEMWTDHYTRWGT